MMAVSPFTLFQTTRSGVGTLEVQIKDTSRLTTLLLAAFSGGVPDHGHVDGPAWVGAAATGAGSGPWPVPPGVSIHELTVIAAE